MERRYWIMFVVVALIVGIVIGGGIGSKASKIPELQLKVDQLSKENAELRAKLGTAPAPAGVPAKTP